MKITIYISDDDVKAALHKAVESGACSWAKTLDIGSAAVAEITPSDDAPDGFWWLNVERGLGLLIANHERVSLFHKGKFRPDVEDCDRLIQYAAFGEIRYG